MDIEERYTILHGDAVQMLKTLPDNSVHCCVTSPPYWGLRDYGVDGQIGLESTPEEYVSRMVEVFREIRRVLRDDGTCWINLGDSYASGGVGRNDADRNIGGRGGNKLGSGNPGSQGRIYIDSGLKAKDLVGIPWRVAFALQADGWYLRQDIIWHKPNPMPESVTDRCTKAHEYVFLLTKSAKYWYDAEAVKERSQYFGIDSRSGKGNIRYDGKRTETPNALSGQQSFVTVNQNRNRRSVWSITTKPYKGAHFATMPPGLANTCILAGCPKDGVTIDPFAGSGTTLAVALQNGRRAIGIELNPEYIDLAERRLEPEREEIDNGQTALFEC